MSAVSRASLVLVALFMAHGLSWASRVVTGGVAVGPSHYLRLDAPETRHCGRIERRFPSAHRQTYLRPRRGSLSGIVFSAMNFSIASAGILTARPQFTRASLRLESHARTVETFRFKASATSATVSRFFIFPSNRARCAYVRKVRTLRWVVPCAVRWAFPSNQVIRLIFS